MSSYFDLVDNAVNNNIIQCHALFSNSYNCSDVTCGILK